MAASSEPLSIPISSTSPQQPFKLLELPTELLALLESSDPPTLTLKSDPATSHALLCSPNATYRVQQKNSSNPLMILKPAAGADGGVTTISKIEDTLELLPYVEGEEKAVKKNKWHEKFAASRMKK